MRGIGYFLIVILTLCQLQAFAQERKVSGKVTDENGEPLMGATVLVTGTEKSGAVGVITDFNGEFNIFLPAGYDSLSFSFIGYLIEVLEVGSQTYMNVRLIPDVAELEAVVVTALGISREAKSLGYSVSKVSGEDMSTIRQINPLNALSGAVAGLNVTSSGNGPGGTTKVVLRGNRSLTGGNEPLYVVDGVPISNSGGSGAGYYGGFDYGNAANNINPDDIESVSVLKGGAAAALYGGAGQNGVILITTKSGQKKGADISFSSNYLFEEIAFYPQFQDQYGQGSNGAFISDYFESWGPKLDGREVTNFLGQTQKLLPTGDPVEGFYRDGYTFSNTLTINSGNESKSLYFSASNLQNENILPNSDYGKLSLNLRTNGKLNEFITFDSKVNYIKIDANNRPNLTGSPDNPMYIFANLPRSVSLDQLRNYKTLDNIPVTYYGKYRVTDAGVEWVQKPVYAQSPFVQNPYWAIHENTNYDTRHRTLAYVDFSFDLAKLFGFSFDLSLKAKSGADIYFDERYRKVADNTSYKVEGYGLLENGHSRTLIMNSDIFLQFYKNFGGNIGIRAMGGGNRYDLQYRSLSANSIYGRANPYVPYVIQSFDRPTASQGIGDQRRTSLYGLLSVDYKSAVYLEVTARNDWSSLLGPENWSFFYPSTSLSFLLHEIIELPSWMNYAKLRGAFSDVGNINNFSPGSLLVTYIVKPHYDYPVPFSQVNPRYKTNKDLLPERTRSYEGGLELRFFESRLDADLTVYQTGTINQIFQAPLAPSSGYTSGIVNAGYISNSGVELSLNTTLVETKLGNQDFVFDLGLNISRNWSKVLELDKTLTSLTLGGAGGASIEAYRYMPSGLLVGRAFERDPEGNVLLDANNLPIWSTESDGDDRFVVLGNINPDVLAGINASLRYGILSMNLQMDGKFGHQIFSITNQLGSSAGTLSNTLAGRDEWQRALELEQQTGIRPTNLGFPVEGVRDGVKGTYYSNPQLYWERMSEIAEPWVYDASFIRLRQIAMGVTLPKKWINWTPLKEFTFSLVASNLFYMMNDVPNVSPESAFGTGNVSGIEMFSVPETRSMGFDVKVRF